MLTHFRRRRNHDVATKGIPVVEDGRTKPYDDVLPSQFFHKTLACLIAFLLACPLGAVAAIPSSPVEASRFTYEIADPMPEWGELVSVEPTGVPSLSLAIYNPLVGDADVLAKSEELAQYDMEKRFELALAAPEIQGKAISVHSLWIATERGQRLLSVVRMWVRESQVVREEIPIGVPTEADSSIRRWKAAILSEIDTSLNLEDPYLLFMIAQYGILANDDSVRQYWEEVRYATPFDCAKGKTAGECDECCEDEYDTRLWGCTGASFLTGVGACFIAAACGPFWGVCCSFGGLAARQALSTACRQKARKLLRECRKTCESIESKNEDLGIQGF